MHGYKYLLTVLAAVAGLSLGVKLLYTRKPGSELVVPAPRPAAESLPKKLAAAEPAKPEATPARQSVNPPKAAARVLGRRQPARVAVVPAPNARMDSASGTIDPLPVNPPKADTITAKPADVTPVWQPSARQLVRDSAYVMTTSGRLQDAINVLDAWAKAHPADTAVGLDLARLRARSRDWNGSIAQYSALIEQNRTAELLYERGQVYLWSGDSQRGEADLLESVKLSPRAETQRQLGDHYRWQGDFARSSYWYRQAMRGAPADTAILGSMRMLDQAMDARLLMPGEMSGGDFGSGVQAISDNAGFDLYALRLSQGFSLPMGSSSVLTLSGELRSAAQMTATAGKSTLDGYGFDAMIATRLGTSKVSASIGMLDHGDASPIVRGGISADAFMGKARVRASAKQTPAYETLWSPRMLGAAGSPVTTLQAQGSVSLPIGSAAELYALGELLSVSDDNSRTAFQFALRRRLAGPLSVVYASSLMSYEQQTALYYSPSRYMSQSMGFEWAKYRDQGLSFALRATPGYAWIREPAGTADSTSLDLTAFQFSTGLELGYRRGAWDLLLSSGFSSGREGGYRSQNAVLYLRRAW